MTAPDEIRATTEQLLAQLAFVELAWRNGETPTELLKFDVVRLAKLLRLQLAAAQPAPRGDDARPGERQQP